MKHIASSALASAILFLGNIPVKADLIRVVDLGSKNFKMQRVNQTTNVATDLIEFNQPSGVATAGSFLDEYNGKLYMAGDNNGYTIYDINENTIEKVPYGLTGQLNNFWPFEWEGTIKKGSDGTVSLGENSWNTKEEGGKQKVWATDAAGNPIPIDYTNGTKLLINGRDVDQAIDNVGALSAALTGLPTVPQDSPLSCGVGAGAGAHSGSNALSGGCASKINERLSFNAAASFIPANQEYQGTDNSWSGRAGFVFKLGKINNPTLISMKEKKALQSEVKNLKSQNLVLISRLEKLEQIALGLTKSTDLASIAP